MKSQYDYSNVLFECILVRKHFISDVKYYCYILNGYMLMSRKVKDSSPKYVLPLQLANQVGWIVERKDKNILFKAITIKYMEKYKDFVGRSSELQKQQNKLSRLKEHLSNKVTFYKIADFYEAQYNLGKGSSAKVIQIKELGNEQSKLAAKAIDKSYLQKSESGMQAFLNEVNILSHLSKYSSCGPFIKLHETFEGDHTFYLILDLMQGRTLADELDILKQRKELFPLKLVKVIMKQLLKGVKLLHEANIIHRDLKPDNIMFRELDSYETLTIVDFGLSTFTDVTKYQFPKCGTPGYVAPEILNLVDRQQKYDKVCDIFSCGCIFYKLLFGHSLFMGNTFNEVLGQNKKCNYTLDTSEMNSIPYEAQELLKQMLAKNPSERITAQLALESDFFNKPSSPLQSKKLKAFNVPNTVVIFQLLVSVLQVFQIILHNDLNCISSRNIFQQTTDGLQSEAESPFQRISQKCKNQVDFDVDIQENKCSSIQIRQLPSVKKPTCVRLEDSTIGSFYAKDPLSSFKKLKGTSQKQLNETKEIQVNQFDVEQMQRISLFNRKDDN